MNEFILRGSQGGGLNAMYYWEQFHPILAAVAILLIGWIIALMVAAGIKKLLQKTQMNQKLSHASGETAHTAQSLDYENILSKFVFWFIFIIDIIATLNVLNISSVTTPFSNMISNVLVFIPSLIAAVVVGFIGWIIARIIRTGLTRVLASTQLDEKLSQDVGVQPISQNIADIVYWLILLLILPLVLSILGLTGLLLPVQNMVNDVVSYLPNIFIAGVIVFIGYILAKIVRGIVEGLANSLSLQQHAEKIGVFKNSSLPQFLGSLVFALVMITALIIGFEALGIQAISQPATAMLTEVMNAIPNIIAAGLILAVAYVVARFVARLVRELIAGTGVDGIPQKLDLQRFLGKTQVSDIVGCLIVFFTMLFAVSEAANRLGLEQVSVLISMFIQFGANILLGAIILVVGFWLANIVANVVQRGEYNSSRWLGGLVRVLIMGLVIAMGLRAMGIADSIVNLAFGLTLGAVAVAFALAFGLGGRQPAERLLTRLMDKAEAEGSQPNPLHASVKTDAVTTTSTTTTDMTASERQLYKHNVVDSDATEDSASNGGESKSEPYNNPYGSTGESKSSLDDPKNDLN